MLHICSQWWLRIRWSKDLVIFTVILFGKKTDWFKGRFSLWAVKQASMDGLLNGHCQICHDEIEITYSLVFSKKLLVRRIFFSLLLHGRACKSYWKSLKRNHYSKKRMKQDSLKKKWNRVTGEHFMMIAMSSDCKDNEIRQGICTRYMKIPYVSISKAPGYYSYA